MSINSSEPRKSAAKEPVDFDQKYEQPQETAPDDDDLPPPPSTVEVPDEDLAQLHSVWRSTKSKQEPTA